jgi:hypothetical protein
VIVGAHITVVARRDADAVIHYAVAANANASDTAGIAPRAI